ncbi:MAG: hypothetical protein IJC78_07515 [Clostridia bacterium]|nr:hypothetical protein [Clostridia bacterium]
MFTYAYEPRYGDFKDYDTIKTGMLLDAVQDVSTRDSARCGYGLKSLKKGGLAWLLQGVNMTFFRPAKPYEVISASTAVKTLKGATSERGCILTQNGEVIAHSIANWFLFDTNKGRIARVTDEMIEAYTFHDFEGDTFTYEKLRPMQDVPFLYTVRVSNKDIDTNRHLNNQRGADMLTDALPFDFPIKKLNILYKKQAYLGEILKVCTKEIENGCYVHLENDAGEVCVCGTFITE